MTAVDEHSNWDFKPPKWMNNAMTFALRTPGLRNVIGKKILLITFTGRKSGKQFTTPVTYFRQDERTVVVLTKAFRPWWRNFEDRPQVEVVIQGRTHAGTASAQMFGEAQFEAVSAFLTANAQDAKYYGITVVDGVPNPDDIRALFGKIVVVTIALG